MTTLVLDVSNHDYSTFNPDCFLQNGVEELIIGCWDLNKTIDMVGRARSVGLTTRMLYNYIYYGQTWEQREVDNGLEVQRQLGGIERVWLDCEAHQPNEAPGMTPIRRIAITNACAIRVRAAGLTPGIYTYGPYWRSEMANSNFFSAEGFELWHAAYGVGGNPIPPITHVTYGGWTRLAGHQYTSTVDLCGRRRDHNYWYLEDEVSTKDYEDLLLAMYSGAEDNVNGQPLPREDRLIRAKERHAVRVSASYRSIADVSETANAAYKYAGDIDKELSDHTTHHPGGGDALPVGTRFLSEVVASDD